MEHVFTVTVLYEINYERTCYASHGLIKEAAIDCINYSKRGNKEQLECVQYGEPVSELYLLDIKTANRYFDKNRETVNWRGRIYESEETVYIQRNGSNTANLYDVELLSVTRKPNINHFLVEEKRMVDYY